MRSDKYSPLTLKVQIGDLEIYTAPDMGFVGRFSVTPKIHSHPYYEIIAVVEGKLKITLFDNRSIKLERGNLCIIPPKCYHCTGADGESTKMLAMRFSYGKIRGDAKIYDVFCTGLESIKEPTFFETPDNMPSTLIQLRGEMLDRKPAWDLVCRALLQRLYIDIFRLLSKDKISDMDNTFDDSKHSRYYQIEMWFADNFAKQVSEDDLASEISISKRHLSRVISDIYGMSFREKLIEVRLHRAAQLLEQTDFNVDKIALAVGYRSFSGFLRAFVDFFGCTPHQYRKNR